MFFGAGASGQQGARAGILGQPQLGSFPPSSALGRSGPPGFGGRGADPNDFPALGSLSASHNQLGNANSTYASQAQSQGSSSHLQQQMYQLHISQGQQHQMDSGLAPPPPPGLAGLGSPSQPNGTPSSSGEGLRDDFPALGVGEKDARLVGMLKMGGAPGSSQTGGSPQQSLNGPSTTQSQSGTASNPQLIPPATGPPSNADSWARQSPPTRSSEPLVRPVQQIMSSPVDKWGLKALLYEIRTQMGKTDRSLLLFGEDLADLGVDVSTSEPLYSSFVTPWVEPGAQQPPQIEDMFVIPSCYHVVPPPVENKLPNFSEETLFYIFYSAPQDIVQLMAAEELYNRGWRFNTEMRVWMTSGQLAQIDLHGDSASNPTAMRGPFMVFNPATWSRQDTANDFTVELAHLEATRPAASMGEKTRKDTSAAASAVRSPPNGSTGLSGSQQYQNMQAAH